VECDEITVLHEVTDQRSEVGCRRSDAKEKQDDSDE
jgi:hypothetical protein